MRDAYIVTSVRTPGCRRGKGAFKDTRPEDLLSFILKAAVEKTTNLEPAQVEDLMIGCSFPEAEQGLNIGRIAGQIAGFPESVSGATVNRFCSSGLEAMIHQLSDWRALLRLAGRHGMKAFLHRHFHRRFTHIVPGEIRRHLREDYYRNLHGNLLLERELIRILKLLEDQGIRAVPFKGVALAECVYGDIALRPRGDIDILVRKGDAVRVAAPGSNDVGEDADTGTKNQPAFWRG